MIKSSDRSLEPLVRTGIGSLPGSALAEALESAFFGEIPYFPSFPELNPNETLFGQALGGFPGAEVLQDGSLHFDRKTWLRSKAAYRERLAEAFNRNCYGDFLATAFPKLWDDFGTALIASGARAAKAQLIGPITLLGALQVDVENERELAEQLKDLLFARAMAFATGIRLRGKDPILFLDEPSIGDPHPTALGLLKELSEDLQNAGVSVGIHCCGRFAVSKLLGLKPDVLSFDIAISLEDVLAAAGPLAEWRSSGGILAWGTVPTELAAGWSASAAADRLYERLTALQPDTGVGTTLLQNSWLTPACGLGSRTLVASRAVFAELATFREALIHRCN